MKKRKNSITKLIACVLVLTLSLTIIQPLSVFAQQDISSPETKPEKWIPSKEDMQLPNTAGDLTIEQLETAKLSAEDIPEFITDKEIKGKGHVNRLREQEPDDNTVIFQNRDGTKTAYLFSTPVKYTDESGKTKDKNTKLENKDIPIKYSEKYGYVNQQNNIKTYFPKQMTSEQGLLLESEDIAVELLPLDATEEKYVLQNGCTVSPSEYFSKNKTATKTFSSSSVSDDVAKIQNKKITAKEAAADKIHITEEFTDDEKDTIQYDDVFGSETTLRYSTTFNGLKEDIILYENTGINNFRFKLKTNGLSLVCNEHGEYYLADPLTGENLVAISKLFIYDSNNKVYKNEYAKEYYHYYEAKTIKPDEEYILSVVVDEEFLNSPDTVYPVYIDPTMTVINKGFVQDATLYSETDERATSGEIKIGYNGTTYGKSRGLYNFPFTKFNKDFIFMYGNQIESADLNLYALPYGDSQYAAYDAAKTLSMYEFKSPWSYATVKWRNTNPDNYGKFIDSTSVTYGWTTFNISYIIDKFKTDSDYATDFNGVIIKAYSETASTWKKFVSSWGTSSKQPYVSITYNDTPAACPQIASGTKYYLKNSSGDYLDVYNKETSDNTRVLTYEYNGNTNQQFKITHISGGEYEIAPQHTSGKVLSVNSSKQVILEEDSNASRQRWYIYYRNGNYHIVNKAYKNGLMAPTYDTDYVSINNEYDYCCWKLERAYFGVAWEYKKLGEGHPNCFGYALNLDYTPYLAMSYGDSVSTVAARVKTYVESIGRSIRYIDGPTSEINSNEYRFCMRVANKSDGKKDYHFWVQTNMGAWCEKNGTCKVFKKQFYVNPTTADWDLPIINVSGEVIGWESNYYDSDTIYFAASLS